MKVLLLGATGNLGSRLVPSLLSQGHAVVAYVRSTKKLESLLPGETYRQLVVVQGNAADKPAIKQAILDNRCEAVINTAGLAAVLPWNKSDLPTIFRAVVEAAVEAGEERKQPLRAWFLGGMGVLNYPGTGTQVSKYVPMFLEHVGNLGLLRSLPSDALNWSMLCPANMTSESPTLSLSTGVTGRAKLTACADALPLWQKSWVTSLPLIGVCLTCLLNFSRYETTLEQNADLIADDLQTRDSQWIGHAVGIIDASK